MKMPDFSLYEEPIKKDIEEYFELYKNAYSEEKIILKQMKDNIELLDFLNFKGASKDIKNKLEAAKYKVNEGCKNYAKLLYCKSEVIQGNLGNMCESVRETKDAKELKKISQAMLYKSTLVKECQNDIIKMIMFWKNISLHKAIKEYLKYFPKNSFIKHYKKKSITNFIESFISIMIIIVFSVLIMSLIIAVIGAILSTSWSMASGIIAFISFIILLILGFIISTFNNQ